MDRRANYGKGRGRGRGRSGYANTNTGTYQGGEYHERRQRSAQRGPYLGYRKLQELKSTEPSEIAVSLLQCRESFKILVSSDDIKEDWMTLLIEILGKMCETQMTQNLIEVMSICKGSAFMRTHLPKYIINLPMIQEEESESQFTSILECLVAFFKEWLNRFPRLSSEVPIDHLGGSLKEIDVKEVEKYRKEVEMLLSRRRELMVEERREAQANKGPKPNKRREVEQAPPDDFRKMSIYPNEKEIRSEEKPFLRRNKTEKSEAYKDLNDYLDVQFRLLREDFVSPLRDGIREITKNTPKEKRSQNLYIYENVDIMDMVCTRAGIVHSIRLDMRNLRRIPWEHSKRLLFGSFLCLSKDNFKTMLFATVANRKAEDLRLGRLDIRFVDSLEEIQTKRDKYVMVESPAYFESYRPVLEQLKNITPDNFPFQEYLVHCNSNVKSPQYLRIGILERQVRYDLDETLKFQDGRGGGVVSICDPRSWPKGDEVDLNESQLEALKDALTKEFSVIQGPPGTGKTYVGLKIVRALLDNRHEWDAEKTSAMLMVCYTNHALDQFLEGVLKFQQTGVIRVGGRSSSEILQPYNLQEYTTSSENKRRVKVEMMKCQDAIGRASGRLVRSKETILTLKDLVHFAGRMHLEQLRMEECRFGAQGKSVVKSWLGLKTSGFVSPFNENGASDVLQAVSPNESVPIESSLSGSDTNVDPNGETEDGIDVDKDADIIQSRRLLGENQYEIIVASNSAKAEIKQPSGLSKDHLKVLRGESTLQPMLPFEVAAVQNVWRLEPAKRWRLYLFWLRLFQANCRDEISRKSQEYESICKRFTEVRECEDLHALREAVVIGMTTTGAAKYRNLLEIIKPTVVIVEEAAEVLEAHIITSLTKGTQHLILIGDHKQLRPNPTVYSLAREYNLDVSLFERMVNSGMRCHQLTTQHRMRPEIARLMRFIYEDLQDHQSVHEYEDVRGVSKNIFFINHRIPEDESEINEKIKSHSNQHEAEYIAALCEYFLLQGYERNQITVLTMYSGQVLALKRTMPKFRFEGVRVTAVDNFQGEENDIILLSLVRCNKQKNIGFLAVKNRVCVALSRARHGLYCIGNFAMLADKNELWKKIVKDMKEQGTLGESLELVCKNHPDRVIHAKYADDFKKAPEGGCILQCSFRLPCGHVCERVCHPDDSDHALYKCQKYCLSELCSEHQSKCERKCHFGEDCAGCPVEVEKRIPKCGHQQLVPCGTPAETFKCQIKCFNLLICRHFCPGKCWEECSSFACENIVKRQFECGHEIEKPCYQLSEGGYRCEEPCRATLECGHPCVGNCSDCQQGRMHVACQADCNRRRVCLHLCEEPCTKNCPPCPKKCENRCCHSRCPKTCMDLCSPCREPCSWSCQHKKCTKLCGEKCNRERCNEPCRKRRVACPYNHPCIGLCGEPCPKLCGICHKEKVTDLFFGTEDDEDARFIELLDCNHVFEVTALDYWMDKDGENEDIKLKECPRCKTPIRISYRYADIVKVKLAEVEEVKKRLIEDEEQFQDLKQNLERERRHLVIKYPDIAHKRVFSENSEEQALNANTYETLRSWLQQRKTMAELTTIKNQMKILKQIYKVREKVKTDLLRNTSFGVLNPPSACQTVFEQKFLQGATEIDEKLNYLELELMKFQISPQRLTDIRDEVICTSLLLKIRVVQCEAEKRSITLGFDSEGWLEIQGKQLNAGTKISEEEVETIDAKINEIRKKCGLEGLTPEERVMIVKAMNFSQGHWYKCPNGHIYAIGDCGGAMEERRCPECDVIIGGTNHHLAQGNKVATEMDGALHPAWSNQTNLLNYDPEELRRLQFGD